MPNNRPADVERGVPEPADQHADAQTQDEREEQGGERQLERRRPLVREHVDRLSCWSSSTSPKLPCSDAA